MGMCFCHIPGGSFQMGYPPDSDASPVHEVTLSPFWIGQFAVTNSQYDRFHLRPRFPESLGNRQPAVCVSWDDAVSYCQWLSKRDHHHYRLPTEAEWEYAARGGLEKKDYPWGDEDPEGRATFNSLATTPVGSYAPNGYGLTWWVTSRSGCPTGTMRTITRVAPL